MFITLFSTRLTARNISSLAPHAFNRSAAISFLPIVSQTRNFSVSRAACEPPVAKDADVDEGEPKTSKKRRSSSTKKASSETKAAPKKKKAVEEEAVAPKKVKIRKEDQPPKRPSAPWMRFVQKFYSENKDSSGEDMANCAKNAAVVWGAMSEHEKQPYRDDYVKAKAEWEVKFQEYSRNVAPAVIKEINLQRQQKGQRRVILNTNDKKPIGSYMRFALARRATLGVQHRNLEDAVNFAKESGAAWKALSEEEKQVYRDAYEKENREYHERKDAEASSGA